MRDIALVAERLWWDHEDAEHIRTRSARYPGAVDLEPAWTLEAAADLDSLVRQPDPKSRAGYTRLIGHSPSAGAVLTVIIDPDDGRRHGLASAWSRPTALPRQQGVR